MRSLYAATQNKNKIAEINQLLSGKFNVLSVFDLPVDEELPETGYTLSENALQKARYIYQKFGVDCFADDTGLEVEALNGEPGVYSARYAGLQKNADDNMHLLLHKMAEKHNRKARFVTIIALIIKGKEHLFEGVIEGEIIRKKTGTGGFGYDPIFKPEGFDRTFAEMSLAEKSVVSHRGRAVKAMTEFLDEHFKYL